MDEIINDVGEVTEEQFPIEEIVDVDGLEVDDELLEDDFLEEESL